MVIENKYAPLLFIVETPVSPNIELRSSKNHCENRKLGIGWNVTRGLVASPCGKSKGFREDYQPEASRRFTEVDESFKELLHLSYSRDVHIFSGRGSSCASQNVSEACCLI